MNRKILYAVAVAWVLAFIWQTYAHAVGIDLGTPISPLIRPRIWNCGSAIVLVEPNDPVWKSDLIFFTKGTMRMAVREGHLTYEHSEKIPIAKCTRQPLLAGDPFFSNRSRRFRQSAVAPSNGAVMKRRKKKVTRVLIVCDEDCNWYVRRIRRVVRDLDRDELIYRCDRPMKQRGRG